MEIFERPYTNDEIKLLKSHRFSIWEYIESFLKKWMLLTFISIVPFLLYEKFIADIPSSTELIQVIISQILIVVIIFYLMKLNGEFGRNKTIKNEIKKGKAQVLKIKTDTVIKRKDPEDFGSGFYIKIDTNKTLFLQGQYFDELQYSRKFPNTDFEIVRSTQFYKSLIHINSNGEYLKPKRKINPFSKDDYKNGNIHYDGDILDTPIENIKA